MEYIEGKEKFIAAWGGLASNWGVSRTMAQVHALLLLASKPLCAEDIMQELQISRGNVNMNVRALIDWGLVFKEIRQGERREFFKAEKDMWKVFCQIIINRKRKELDPMIEVLNTISIKKGDQQDEEAEEFSKVVNDLKLYASKADKALENLASSKAQVLLGGVMKMMR
jgi:DNA-binding transcriptional regulator GbsR (MarR family)